MNIFAILVFKAYDLLLSIAVLLRCSTHGLAEAYWFNQWKASTDAFSSSRRRPDLVWDPAELNSPVTPASSTSSIPTGTGQNLPVQLHPARWPCVVLGIIFIRKNVLVIKPSGLFAHVVFLSTPFSPFYVQLGFQIKRHLRTCFKPKTWKALPSKTVQPRAHHNSFFVMQRDQVPYLCRGACCASDTQRQLK